MFCEGREIYTRPFYSVLMSKPKGICNGESEVKVKVNAILLWFSYRGGSFTNHRII